MVGVDLDNLVAQLRRLGVRAYKAGDIALELDPVPPSTSAYAEAEKVGLEGEVCPCGHSYEDHMGGACIAAAACSSARCKGEMMEPS